MAELLGYTLIDKIHYDIWERIKNRTKPHVLLLMHRHGIKSTVFNYCDNVCRVLKDPATTGLIYSATHPISMSMLDATKNILKNNKTVFKHFGDVQGDTWTGAFIRVAGAQGSLADNVYTIETGGVEKGLASKHYNWIKIDDAVNEENYEHPLSRDMVLRRFKSIFNLLKRNHEQSGKWGSEVWVLGTRYHPEDLYQYIIDNLSDIFEIIIVPPTHKVNGVEVPTLTKVFPTMQSLEQVKVELGPYGYACQMEQNPHFKANNCLDFDKISVIPDDELQRIFIDMKNNRIPQEQLALIMDPADEITRGANHTGLALMRYDGKTLDVLRVWKLKMILDTVLKVTAKILHDCGIKYFYCEKSGLENNVNFYLTQKLAEYRLEKYVVQEGVSHSLEAKNSRIMALQPLIDSGKVRRARTYSHPVSKENPEPVDMFKLLETEVRGFPDLQQDDLLDPIAYSIRREVFDLSTHFIKPPGQPTRHKTAKEMADEELDRIRNDNPSKRVRKDEDDPDAVVWL